MQILKFPKTQIKTMWPVKRIPSSSLFFETKIITCASFTFRHRRPAVPSIGLVWDGQPQPSQLSIAQISSPDVEAMRQAQLKRLSIKSERKFQKFFGVCRCFKKKYPFLQTFTFYISNVCIMSAIKWPTTPQTQLLLLKGVPQLETPTP